MNFQQGGFVRYVKHGPRRALSGAIGVVLSSTDDSAEQGWVRVHIAGRADDYSSDEFEPARFWSFISAGSGRWTGPHETWEQATASLSELLKQETGFSQEHPLAYRRDRLIKDLFESDPVPSGIVGYHPSVGEARIEVAGNEQPPLFDVNGKRYA